MSSGEDRLEKFMAERRAERQAAQGRGAGTASAMAEGKEKTKKVLAKWEEDKKALQRVTLLLNERLGEFGIKIGAAQFKAGNSTPVSASAVIVVNVPKEGARVLSFNVFAAGNLKAYFQTANKGESGTRLFDVFEVTESTYRDVVLEFLELP